MEAPGQTKHDTAVVWAEALASRSAPVAAPSQIREEDECSEATGHSRWTAATPLWRPVEERSHSAAGAGMARGLGESASVASDYATGAHGVAEARLGAAGTTPDR